MLQLTLRLPERLVRQLKAAAGMRGESVNRLATAVLTAAVDPTYAADEAQALRERLARAGLLVAVARRARTRAPRAALARARAAAGRGRALSALVSEGRR